MSGGGRLIIKDAIMAGAALVFVADSANASLWKRNAAPRAGVSERGLALAQDVQ
jgi:hypothetical protein